MSDQVMLKKDDIEIVLPAPKRKSTDNGLELQFLALMPEQKTAIADFFENTVVGMKETWTYVDQHGRHLPARFDEPALVFVVFEEGTWDLSTRIALVGYQVIAPVTGRERT